MESLFWGILKSSKLSAEDLIGSLSPSKFSRLHSNEMSSESDDVSVAERGTDATRHILHLAELIL